METTIKVTDLTKIYNLYDKPIDRLKESLNFTKKSYHKEHYALKDVNFEIKKGETVGIVGKNGSGKSTLLKILSGVLSHTRGSAQINGRVSALLELGAGFNSEYTGMENIYLHGTMMGFSKKEMDERVDEILNFADIGDYIHQPVKTYSSGMFVRLAFAVAINVDPEILIIDEALAVGDVRFQLKCMNKFLEFKEKNISIIFVSHDTNAIKRFCDRAIWINEGNLLMDGDVDTVTDRYLDYLKELDHEKERKETAPESVEDDSEDGNNDHIEIAEIRRVRIYNAEKEECSSVDFGEKVSVRIDYYVKDESIEHPVLGVAILRIDNLYVCGVNTLLDKIEIPWKKGLNTLQLEYKEFNLIGGSYYLDVALYDQTATVAIDYRAKIKELFVNMEYIAEGISILRHSWK